VMADLFKKLRRLNLLDVSEICLDDLIDKVSFHLIILVRD
jgi:hypothetical protein